MSAANFTSTNAISIAFISARRVHTLCSTGLCISGLSSVGGFQQWQRMFEKHRLQGSGLNVWKQHNWLKVTCSFNFFHTARWFLSSCDNDVIATQPTKKIRGKTKKCGAPHVSCHLQWHTTGVCRLLLFDFPLSHSTACQLSIVEQ